MTPFIAFLVVAVVVIVTPGPDTALTIRNTLRGGRRGGVFTAVGVVTGQAIWALATSVGLAALLAAWSEIFAAIRFAGAIYLVCLGVQVLVGAWRASRQGNTARVADGVGTLSPRVAWQQGLVSNLLNPKMAAFFPSLLPQFAGVADDALLTLLVFGLVFCVITLGWLVAYTVVLPKLGVAVGRSNLWRLVEGVTGAVLIGFGLRLALERRQAWKVVAVGGIEPPTRGL